MRDEGKNHILSWEDLPEEVDNNDFGVWVKIYKNYLQVMSYNSSSNVYEIHNYKKIWEFWKLLLPSDYSEDNKYDYNNGYSLKSSDITFSNYAVSQSEILISINKNTSYSDWKYVLPYIYRRIEKETESDFSASSISLLNIWLENEDDRYLFKFNEDWVFMWYDKKLSKLHLFELEVGQWWQLYDARKTKTFDIWNSKYIDFYPGFDFVIFKNWSQNTKEDTYGYYYPETNLEDTLDYYKLNLSKDKLEYNSKLIPEHWVKNFAKHIKTNWERLYVYMENKDKWFFNIYSTNNDKIKESDDEGYSTSEMNDILKLITRQELNNNWHISTEWIWDIRNLEMWWNMIFVWQPNVDLWTDEENNPNIREVWAVRILNSSLKESVFLKTPNTYGEDFDTSREYKPWNFWDDIAVDKWWLWYLAVKNSKTQYKKWNIFPKKWEISIFRLNSWSIERIKKIIASSNTWEHFYSKFTVWWDDKEINEMKFLYPYILSSNSNSNGKWSVFMINLSEHHDKNEIKMDETYRNAIYHMHNHDTQQYEQFWKSFDLNQQVVFVWAPWVKIEWKKSWKVYWYVIEDLDKDSKQDFSIHLPKHYENRENALFGNSVSLSDNVLAVGAPGMYKGLWAVYLYKRKKKDDWEFYEKIIPIADDKQFGSSVEINNGYLIVKWSIKTHIYSVWSQVQWYKVKLLDRVYNYKKAKTIEYLKERSMNSEYVDETWEISLDGYKLSILNYEIKDQQWFKLEDGSIKSYTLPEVDDSYYINNYEESVLEEWLENSESFDSFLKQYCYWLVDENNTWIYNEDLAKICILEWYVNPETKTASYQDKLIQNDIISNDQNLVSSIQALPVYEPAEIKPEVRPEIDKFSKIKEFFGDKSPLQIYWDNEQKDYELFWEFEDLFKNIFEKEEKQDEDLETDEMQEFHDYHHSKDDFYNIKEMSSKYYNKEDTNVMIVMILSLLIKFWEILFDIQEILLNLDIEWWNWLNLWNSSNTIPYLEKTYNFSFKTWETKTVELSWENFSVDTDLINLPETYKYSVVSRSPSKISFKITAPESSSSKKEISLSGHEKWWNGSKIYFETKKPQIYPSIDRNYNFSFTPWERKRITLRWKNFTNSLFNLPVWYGQKLISNNWTSITIEITAPSYNLWKTNVSLWGHERSNNYKIYFETKKPQVYPSIDRNYNFTFKSWGKMQITIKWKNFTNSSLFSLPPWYRQRLIRSSWTSITIEVQAPSYTSSKTSVSLWNHEKSNWYKIYFETRIAPYIELDFTNTSSMSRSWNRISRIYDKKKRIPFYSIVTAPSYNSRSARFVNSWLYTSRTDVLPRGDKSILIKFKNTNNNVSSNRIDSLISYSNWYDDNEFHIWFIKKDELQVWINDKKAGSVKVWNVYNWKTHVLWVSIYNWKINVYLNWERKWVLKANWRTNVKSWSNKSKFTIWQESDSSNWGRWDNREVFYWNLYNFNVYDRWLYSIEMRELYNKYK